MPTQEQIENSINHHPYMTPAQAKFIYDLVTTRFEADAPELEHWRNAWRSARDHESVDLMIKQLKEMPTLTMQRNSASAKLRADAPTEDGFYRNPATGELYRIATNKSGTPIVSKYSKTAAKRLTVDNEVVAKGTWKRYSTWDSNRARYGGLIKREWLITPDELVEYKYGFCSYCHRGLKDSESVARNYGEDCAKKYGRPYGGLAASLAQAK